VKIEISALSRRQGGGILYLIRGEAVTTGGAEARTIASLIATNGTDFHQLNPLGFGSVELAIMLVHGTSPSRITTGFARGGRWRAALRQSTGALRQDRAKLAVARRQRRST
jgi:hypothetical protein